MLVMKFGGTSVGDGKSRRAAVNHILNASVPPIVVVSAMGRKGAPYATDTLKDLVSQEGGEVSLRDMDLIMSCGEIISAVVMAQAIRNKGRSAKALTGAQAGIATDGKYSNATVTGVDIRPIKKLLEDGIIPVITGFQGDFEGDFTTLGRGGSDTTAAVLAKALSADEVQIFTDVEGVLTTDPAMNNNAKILPFLTYEEVLEMAHLGAKVIHPKAVEILEEARIPIRIRSTTKESLGTLISSSFGGNNLRQKQVVSSVAAIPSRCLVEVKNPDVASVFQKDAKAGVSVDLINVSLESISFTIEATEKEKVAYVLPDALITSGFGKVSVIGAAMRGIPGVMARVVQALSQKGINIIRTADSHTSISCLVKEDELKKAVEALHDAFLLG